METALLILQFLLCLYLILRTSAVRLMSNARFLNHLAYVLNRSGFLPDRSISKIIFSHRYAYV